CGHFLRLSCFFTEHMYAFLVRAKFRKKFYRTEESPLQNK
ncbi:hypothetical protein X975_03813, partial [Stegodyphus mimosarum]